MSDRALIFGKHDPCDKPFPLAPCRDIDFDLFKVKFVAAEETTILLICLLKRFTDMNIYSTCNENFYTAHEWRICSVKSRSYMTENNVNSLEASRAMNVFSGFGSQGHVLVNVFKEYLYCLLIHNIRVKLQFCNSAYLYLWFNFLALLWIYSTARFSCPATLTSSTVASTWRHSGNVSRRFVCSTAPLYQGVGCEDTVFELPVTRCPLSKMQKWYKAHVNWHIAC